MAIRTAHRSAMLLLSSVSVMLAAGCARHTGIDGTWEGTIDVAQSIKPENGRAPKPIRVVMKLDRDGDRLRGTFCTPEESPEEVPADSVAYDNGRMVMRVDKRMAVCELKMNEDCSQLTGTFAQKPYAIPMSLTRTAN